MSDTRPTWTPLGIAVLRFALIPLVALIESTITYPRRGPDPGFDVLLVAAAVYALLALVLSARARRDPPGGWMPYLVVDVTFLGLLTWRSGGETSELRSILAALPFVVALVGRPRATAATAGLVLVAYVAATEVRTGTPNRNYLLGQCLLLAWRDVLAILLSAAITHARERMLLLSNDRQRMIDEVEAAAEQERQRLAYALHDEAIQSLHAAKLQLGRAARGNTDALPIADEAVQSALSQLHETVANLRPGDLHRVGLPDALQEVARRLTAGQPRPEIDIAVDLDTGCPQRELMFAIARELLTNAVRHSSASHIALTLRRHEDTLVLGVDDDGRGMHRHRAEEARQEGHLGLAACRERVAARGGQMTINSNNGDGTSVTVMLPANGVSVSPTHQS